MDQAFATALVEASRQGVQILAYDTHVKEDVLLLHKPLPVYLMEMEENNEHKKMV